MASITDQFGNTQQALQELQAEFADQSHEHTDLQAQLTSSKALHAELQALHKVQAASVLKLNQQLSTVQSSNQDFQVFYFMAMQCHNRIAHVEAVRHDQVATA